MSRRSASIDLNSPKLPVAGIELAEEILVVNGRRGSLYQMKFLLIITIGRFVLVDIVKGPKSYKINKRGFMRRGH